MHLRLAPLINSFAAMKRFNPALLLALSACSSLGGRNASDWTPTVLARTDTPALPDYSFAGYRWGEATPPRPSATIVQASAYGVVANDGSDDTAGLRAAVAAASRVTGWAVVQLPAGEVELRNLLFLERSQLVLRGAGSGAGGTVLRMPHPMRDMDQPNVMTELNTYLRASDKRADNKEFFTPYSWTGGIIWTRVPEGTPAASNVSIAGDARGTRDSHQFTVSKLGSLRVGQTVRLGWFNRDGKNGPFLQHLYGKRNGLAGARLRENLEVPLITQEVMSDAISGTAITIHEPLLQDLRPEWSAVLAPEVRLEEVRLAEVGVEGLRIEFPNVPYVLHHLEPGYNAIYLTDVRNGWVRDVRLKKTRIAGF